MANTHGISDSHRFFDYLYPKTAKAVQAAGVTRARGMPTAIKAPRVTATVMATTSDIPIALQEI